MHTANYWEKNDSNGSTVGGGGGEWVLICDGLASHSRPQSPRSSWSAPRNTFLGADQEERRLWGQE